jgi:tripartite ATP-independent transporter DctP family solute receptor
MKKGQESHIKLTASVFSIVLCLFLVNVFDVGIHDACARMDIPYIKANKYTLRLGSSAPASDDFIHHKAEVLFAHLVQAYSRGELKIDLYPGNQLGTETVAAKMVQLGTLDMTMLSINNATQWYPPMNVYVMPFIFRNREHVDKVIFGPVGKELEENYRKASGMRILTWFEWGDRCPLNKIRPINKPEDFHGIKMRTPKNPVMIDTYNALGAISTAVNWAELYSALQQGVADGVEGPPKGLHQMKFTEILNFYSYIPVFYGLQPILINEKSFQRLSKEDQEIMIKAAQIAGKYQRWGSVLDHQEGLDILRKAGIHVNIVKDRQPFIEKVRPVWKKYREKIGAEWFEKIVNTQ